MKKYTIYASICDQNELWTSSTHEATWCGAIVKAKSLKEAMQIFYDSSDCQKFIEKEIVFNNIHFYNENKLGNKTYYHGYIEL